MKRNTRGTMIMAASDAKKILSFMPYSRRK
jgi:ribosomal protein L35